MIVYVIVGVSMFVIMWLLEFVSLTKYFYIALVRYSNVLVWKKPFLQSEVNEISSLCLWKALWACRWSCWWMWWASVASAFPDWKKSSSTSFFERDLFISIHSNYFHILLSTWKCKLEEYQLYKSLPYYFGLLQLQSLVYDISFVSELIFHSMKKY